MVREFILITLGFTVLILSACASPSSDGAKGYSIKAVIPTDAEITFE